MGFMPGYQTARKHEMLVEEDTSANEEKFLQQQPGKLLVHDILFMPPSLQYSGNPDSPRQKTFFSMHYGICLKDGRLAPSLGRWPVWHPVRPPPAPRR
jgi:hypothetical protein